MRVRREGPGAPPRGARRFAAVPVKLTAPPLWLVTKRNMPKTNGIFPVVAGYRSQFLKLWGKAK